MEGALGISSSPLAFGLSFVPSEPLRALAPGARTPAEALVRASTELDAAFAFVSASSPWAEKTVVELAEAGVAPFWVVDGPLWPVIEARGVRDGLRALITDPEAIGAELDARLEITLADIRRGIDAGARAIVIAEDLAGNQGPLVAPDFVNSDLAPRLTVAVDVGRVAHVPSILHTDGDVRPLLGAIRRSGFVAIHGGGGLDFDGFERLLRAARAEELAVLGGLSTLELARGLPAAEVLGSRIGILAAEGGLLLADDGGITESGQLLALVTALAAARSV